MNNFNSILPCQATRRVVFSFCLLAIAASAQAVNLTFRAEFQAPTCEVSAPAMLDFETLLSSDIKQGNSPVLPLDVTLSQCGGFIGSQKPGVSVTGEGNTSAGEFLFRSAASQSVNYGVRITTSTDAIVQNSSFLPASLTSANFDGGSTVIPLKVALSCGNLCNNAATQSGALTAAITFAFAYQ